MRCLFLSRLPNVPLWVDNQSAFSSGFRPPSPVRHRLGRSGLVLELVLFPFPSLHLRQVWGSFRHPRSKGEILGRFYFWGHVISVVVLRGVFVFLFLDIWWPSSLRHLDPFSLPKFRPLFWEWGSFESWSLACGRFQLLRRLRRWFGLLERRFWSPS